MCGGGTAFFFFSLRANCRKGFATAGLLAVLCALHPRFCCVFLALLALDVSSHWFQMYATLAQGASTHKVRVCVGKECGGGG